MRELEGLKRLEVRHLLERANEALALPKNQTLPPEDECLRVELAQRYVNLAISIRKEEVSRP